MKDRNGNILRGISAQGKVSRKQKRQRQQKIWQTLTNISVVIGSICLVTGLTLILASI